MANNYEKCDLCDGTGKISADISLKQLLNIEKSLHAIMEQRKKTLTAFIAEEERLPNGKVV